MSNNKLYITNIKFSIKFIGINCFYIINLIKNVKHKNLFNFLIIYSKFTYIIFKSNNKILHCNITKVQSYRDIYLAKKRFKNIFMNATILSTNVDNICATKNLNKKINLDKLFYKLLSDNQRIYHLNYNIQKFPGLFIKFKKDILNGTLIIFKSGKINYVGMKSPLNCLQIENWVTNNV